MSDRNLGIAISVILKFIVRFLAMIGAFTIIAAASYLYHSDAPKKVALSARCINSACDHPCTKKPSRFIRHAGECNEQR